MSNQQSTVYHGDVIPRPGLFKTWERYRHTKAHWFVECFAEFLGVFFYVYGGVGSTAAFVIGGITSNPALGSLLQVGFGYAFGILIAILVAGSTSGGHLSPAVTIAMVLFRGFPKIKAVRYIIAQILGAYVACLMVHAQYSDLINQVAELVELTTKVPGGITFTPTGLGGILGLYLQPGITLGHAFLNEFITDIFLSLAIWACFDPANLLFPPQAAPWVISFAYACAIWGYAPAGLAANTARDLGGRLANMTLYGTKAAGGSYAAISALTNIPAMLIAVLIYEFMFTDPDRVVPTGGQEFLMVHKNHRRLGFEVHPYEKSSNVRQRNSSSIEEKGRSEMYENA